MGDGLPDVQNGIVITSGQRGEDGAGICGLEVNRVTFFLQHVLPQVRNRDGLVPVEQSDGDLLGVTAIGAIVTTATSG